VWIKVGSLHFFENETYLTSVLSCRGFLKIKCQTQEIFGGSKKPFVYKHNQEKAMTENKKTVEKYMEGFNASDHSKILSV
jgi:hypothetical protein